MPIGKRPTPKVAKGKSPRYNTGSGSYSGTHGTRTPTGSRPVPNVAKNRTPSTATPGPTKPAIKNTPMPAPKQAATSRDTSKGR